MTITRLTTGDFWQKARNFEKEPNLVKEIQNSEIKFAKMFQKVLQTVDFGWSFVVSSVASKSCSEFHHHYH